MNKNNPSVSCPSTYQKKQPPQTSSGMIPCHPTNYLPLSNFSSKIPTHYYDKIHCENDCYYRPSVERCFAWMIYLNNIRRGGGTEFVYQRVIAKPRAGDLYIWPAGWTHMHRGVNAPKEVKYILTGWFVYCE